MTVEQLLKPRIKVTADFWNNPFEVGEVIQFEYYKDYYDFITGDILGQDWITDFMELKKHYGDMSAGTSVVWNLRAFTKFPHLFKKLEWWQERKAIDMPQYIKNNSPGAFCFGQIYKVDKILQLSEEFVFKDEISSYSNLHFKHTLPATEQEYTTYIQSHK